MATCVEGKEVVVGLLLLNVVFFVVVAMLLGSFGAVPDASTPHDYYRVVCCWLATTTPAERIT